MENISEWLTMQELLKYLKISRQTALTWIDTKKLPAYKMGTVWRFNKAEVDNWVKTGAANEEGENG